MGALNAIKRCPSDLWYRLLWGQTITRRKKGPKPQFSFGNFLFLQINVYMFLLHLNLTIVNVFLSLCTIALWRQLFPRNSMLNSVLKTNENWLRYALNKNWFYIVFILTLTKSTQNIDKVGLSKRYHTTNFRNQELRHIVPTNVFSMG